MKKSKGKKNWTCVLQVSMQLKVTREDIDDIMVGALEGGITYWCDGAVVEGDYLGEFASEQISRGGKLLLHDAEEGKTYELTLQKLLNGIKLWAENPVGCNCLEQIDGKLVIDCSNADGDVCDAMVQYALFGDVIYS